MTRKGWHSQPSRKALHSQRLKSSRRCDYSTIKCFRFQKRGHFANYCPENKEDTPAEEGGEVTEVLQQLSLAEHPDSYETYDEFAFHQTHRHANPNWIILNTGSTNYIFYNKKMVSNIRLSSGSLKVQCKSVTKAINHLATLKNYGTVWFN
jgi:hypothetical protein